MRRPLTRPGLLGIIERHPLLTFYVLSCAIAWTAVIPYALGAFPAPMLTCGPLIAALIVSAAIGGWHDTKKLLLRMVQWRVRVRWYAFALLLPLAVTLIAVYVNVQMGAPDPTPVLLAGLPSFVLIFLGLLLSPLSGAFGEELGWRGFALPRLLSGRSPLATTLLLGVLVAAWHAPMFVAGLFRPPWLHFVVIVATTVLFMVLYLGGNGSVLLAMLLHAMMNAAPEFLFAPFTGPDMERALILYQVGSLALAGVVTIAAWPRLTGTRVRGAAIAPRLRYPPDIEKEMNTLMRPFLFFRFLVLPMALAVGLTPLAASAAPRSQPSDTATRIDNYIRGRMSNLRVPGFSLVVVEGDQVLLSRGYGLADREVGTAMTADTPVQIASGNKGMIAMALMQLVDQGRVDLDAPVVRYLPDFRMDDERAVDITVRQVLSHTSGIPASIARDDVRDDQVLNREVAALASVPLHFAPGTGYEYANDGYSVALLIVQTVSGTSYDEYIGTQVFQPLRMARSTFDIGVATEWGLTTSYAKRSGVISPGPMALYPAGGVLTTAGDVGHYLVALLNGGSYEGTHVISPSSIAQMWTPEPASGAEAYGFGWGEMNIAGMRLLSHAGDIGAAAPFGSSGSQLLVFPERKIAIGVLANMSSLEKADIAQDTLAIMLGGEPAARPVLPDWRQSSFLPNPDAWASIVGDYQTSLGVLRVYRDGDNLLGFVAGVSMEFVPQADTSFILLSELSALDEVPAEFQPQPDGSVIFGFAGRPFAVKK